MTKALNDYLRSGKFTKKTIYASAGSALRYRVGELYELQRLGRAKLMAIRTDDNQIVTDRKTVIPWERVSLLTMKLRDGTERQIAPPMPPKRDKPEPKNPTLLPDSKGVWLR
jgi:hypothetical protein